MHHDGHGHAGRRASAPAASDDALLTRFLDGDVGAFEAIFYRHRDRLAALAHHLSGDFETGEELVRRAMVRIFSRKDRGRHTVALRLMRAVVRESRRFDHRARLWRAFGRRATLRPRRLLPVRPLGGGREDRRDSARRRSTVEALRRMSHRDREVVALCDLASLTYEEAAAVVGTSPRAVGVRLGRARVRFATWFERLNR